MANLKYLNYEQLKLLIIILSKEIKRLDFLNTAIEKYNITLSEKCHRNFTENSSDTNFNYVSSKMSINALEDDLKDASFLFKESAAKEGLIIVEDQNSGQLDVLSTDGQLIYSKSWLTTGHFSSKSELVVDKLMENANQPIQELPHKAGMCDDHQTDLIQLKKSGNLNRRSSLSIKQSKSRTSSCWSQARKPISQLKTGSTVDSKKDLIYSVSSDETKRIKCRFCDNSYYTRLSLREHMNVMHTDKKPTTMVCLYCGKLVLQSRLNNHLEKVHEKPSYTCHICNRGFLKRECLDGHMNKHTNTKPFICEFCGRKYAYSTSLSSHRRQCTKSLLPSHLLHSKSHEDKVTSCICEICGITFEGTSGLKDHHSAKHSSKVQTCSYCGKGFHWRPSYNRHVKKCKNRTEEDRVKASRISATSPGKLYLCKCGKQYPYRQSFHRHLKTCAHNQQLHANAMS